MSVLITGAGGFIGSALARAIAAAGPEHLVLLDSSEEKLFDLQQQFESVSDDVSCEFVLGSVNDADLLEDVFTRFQPEIVYHAAAFKHVPLLERHPLPAVRNNTIGTYTLAQAALRHSTPKVVLISTDKAVNPRSVLGVSKRLAELVVVAFSNPVCRMSAIRLCNVIGSTGSVVPIFSRQIAEHRPVSVTHPDAARWFITRDRAVCAILAAGSGGIDGRILVPELGAPTRIADLAKSLIGTEDEIPIVFTGCRPGDKLAEELAYPYETKEGSIQGLLQVFKTR